jgi:hypothetical protein
LLAFHLQEPDTSASDRLLKSVGEVFRAQVGESRKLWAFKWQQHFMLLSSLSRMASEDFCKGIEDNQVAHLGGI